MIPKMVKKWNGFWTKSTLVGLGLGQLLSLLFTITGFTSSQIAKKGIDAPLTQCFFYYVLLFLVNGGIMVHRREYHKGNWYYHLILFPLDICAKALVITAYQHTSLTRVMLLDCWTIWLFFKTKYGFRKLVGVAICVGGIITLLYSDTHTPCPHFGDPLQENAHLGDLSIIVGAIFYGFRNVCEEFLVTKVDRVELMALLGFYGASFTAPFKERTELKSNSFSPGTIFLFIGFSLAMFLFHSGVPLLLKIGGSRMLNLSLLSSNIWAVLIQNFAYHEKVDSIYFVAFAVVTLGLIIYSWGDEIDLNNDNVAAIDEETGLGHSKNIEISFQRV